MEVTPIIAVLLLLLLLHTSSRTAYSQSENSQCSRQDYDLCVKMADPLLKDPHLIFPDNRADIDLVCRRWSQFVDCVKRYTDRCFTESRRQEFNKAVENPVDSVHQMCTVTKYQTEYLKHASCIKSTLTQDEHCGRHYHHLVDQVSGEANRVSLCCSHLRFRECVLEETKRQCDSGTDGGSATHFSRQMLDKALSFLRDQCYNYIPTTGECPGLSILTNPYNGQDESTNNRKNVPDQQHRPSNHHPYSPDVTSHPWQSQGTGADRRGMTSSEIEGPSPWMPSGGGSGHRSSSARDSWTPVSDASSISSSSAPPYDSIQPNNEYNKPSWLPGQSSDTGVSRSVHTPSDITSPALPTSTYPTMGQVPNNRPSSYGRGITWTPSTDSQTSNSDFGSNTWHVSSNGAVSSQHPTEPWYPAVGNYGSNSVDEPNQQGLSNNNLATRILVTSDMMLIIASIMMFVLI
ncbi:uncharacterized protein LOC110834083 [Zootermopsis nevadensis]|uniref:Uncharacterized protein n=1 Tax=Zootermopsis nevadensis TaxID=136037 RepID=A0A067QXG7_ZOONE|nr:uncharacterized protein LOC110834083 [Zootermopsis nevadensis]KDR14897.1 hypothetical protein L798_11116 [Zootermopsis nevadensis]